MDLYGLIWKLISGFKCTYEPILKWKYLSMFFCIFTGIVALSPEDVADNVIYAATRPAHVQIAEIVMYATNQSGSFSCHLSLY